MDKWSDLKDTLMNWNIIQIGMEMVYESSLRPSKSNGKKKKFHKNYLFEVNMSGW